MVVLIVLIALILAAPYIYQLFRKDTVINFKDFNAAVAVLDKAEKLPGANQPGADNKLVPPVYSKKAAPGVIIELNTADSAMLTELHGIGPSFARRIIGYRQRLGGFYRKDQLKEVFGLDSMTFAGLAPQVSVDASYIKKIDINTVTFNELSHFPYLSYKQMNAIIRFRDEHGEYETLSDLENIAIIDNITLHKLKPYLKFK